MNVLRELREENNLKQRLLAKLIGVSLSSYNKKENGEVRFSLKEAKIIAEYFEKPIEDIFFEESVSKNDTYCS
jgi:Predicted transcriptional regulators